MNVQSTINRSTKYGKVLDGMIIECKNYYILLKHKYTRYLITSYRIIFFYDQIYGFEPIIHNHTSLFQCLYSQKASPQFELHQAKPLIHRPANSIHLAATPCNLMRAVWSGLIPILNLGEYGKMSKQHLFSRLHDWKKQLSRLFWDKSSTSSVEGISDVCSAFQSLIIVAK